MRLRALVLSVTLFAGLWLACGDDYEGSGPLTGDVGAQCFPDGSCKAGLLCLSNLCVAPPDAAFGGSSGTATEAGASDGGGTDGGDPNQGSKDSGQPRCDETTIDTSGVTPGVVCDDPGKCTPGQICCVRPTVQRWGCAVAKTDCVSDVQRLECDSPADCSDGMQCCMTIDSVMPPSSCAFATVRTGVCAASCAQMAFALCDPAHPCPTPGGCADLVLQLSGGSRLFRRGLCQKAP